MRLSGLVPCVLAVVLPLQPLLAQATMIVPYGGQPTTPVPQAPPADPRDTPEEIAKDAARDLQDSRFYNRPGATRAQYDADWQTCRLIARGSRTPSGTVPMYYNPALMSPVAAGVAGGLGGAIGAAIAEGQQRRANRRSCLLIKGWRVVELPEAEAARVSALGEAERGAYFDGIVGAATVTGKVTEQTSFALAPDPAINLDGPLTGPGKLFLGKKVDPAAPFALGPDEGAIVIAYRRPDAASAGRTGAVQILRYDATARDLVYRPKDWKKAGDKTSYAIASASTDRKAMYEVQVIRATPGDYVVDATSVITTLQTTTNCFGAPTFHVGKGEVVYVGDFVPLVGAKASSGETVSKIAWANHIDDARRTLVASQPALAAALTPAALRNRATYACSAIVMGRWDLPGIEALPEAAAATATGSP